MDDRRGRDWIVKFDIVCGVLDNRRRRLSELAGETESPEEADQREGDNHDDDARGRKEGAHGGGRRRRSPGS